MKPPIHRWLTIGDLIITYTTAGEIADPDWDGFIKELASKPIKKYLGTSNGIVTVNSVKRKQGSEYLINKGIVSAIVTDEKMVRGLVTAVSWLGVNMRAFPWEDLRGAIRHLGKSDIERHIIDSIDRLRKT